MILGMYSKVYSFLGLKATAEGQSRFQSGANTVNTHLSYSEHFSSDLLHDWPLPNIQNMTKYIQMIMYQYPRHSSLRSSCY